ncbi:MAG: glycosyl hydrolase, partial [Acidobacteria bacterium]|nr:glycosyl hydrolase [Acidobacteriota bacterium]
ANVTPRGLPDWMQINSIDVHPFEKGGLYLAGTRYKLDDFTPYLYRTTDYGKTWTRIDAGIEREEFTRVLRADPVRPGLLFAGTERGMWVSFDDGARWQSLQLEMPVVPITDLTVKGDDLIASTQGRGFQVLDDLGALRQLTPGMTASRTQLLSPENAWRFRSYGWRAPMNQGKNPPNGAVVHFNAAAAVGTPVSIAILDAGGAVVREWNGKVEEKIDEPEPTPGANQTPVDPAEQQEQKDEKKDDPKKLTGVHPGMNRFVWNLEYPPAKKVEKMILWSDGGLDGPRALPGAYQVRLTVGDETAIERFTVLKDPRVSASEADLRAQFEFLGGINAKLTETHEAIERIRTVRSQIADVRKKLPETDAAKAVATRAEGLEKELTTIEETLYQTKNQSPQDPLNFPIRLNDKLSHVASSASIGDFAPTAQAVAVRDELVAKIDAALRDLRRIEETEIPALNATIRELQLPAIAAK